MEKRIESDVMLDEKKTNEKRVREKDILPKHTAKKRRINSFQKKKDQYLRDAVNRTDDIWMEIFQYIPLNVKLCKFIGVNKYVSALTLKYYELTPQRNLKFSTSKFL
jgi:predicted metalloprotease